MLLQNKLKGNLRIYPYLEVFRSLIFYVPVWVAFELRYITFSQLTLLESIILGSQLLLELPTGALADLIGRRLSMFIGYLFKSVSLFIYAFASAFPQFLLSCILIGAGEALISGAQEAILYDNLKELDQEKDFSKVTSKLSLIFQCGLSAATLIGGIMNNIYFRLPMIAYGIALFISAIICLFLTEPSLDTEKFTARSYISKAKRGFKELFKNNYIKRVSWFYILVGFITWTNMVVFMTTFLVELGYSEFELGVVLSAIRIFNSLILFKILSVDRLFDRRKTYLFFPIILIISFLPGIVLTKWLALPFIAGSMIASTARWVILGKYTNEEFSSENRATAISALSMLIGIFYVITVAISGPIIDYFGGVKYVYSLLGVLSAILVLPLGLNLANAQTTTSNKD